MSTQPEFREMLKQTLSIIIDPRLLNRVMESIDNWVKYNLWLEQKNMNTKLDKLAALEHEQWRTWAEEIILTETLTPERLARWKQCFVPYEELPEIQKEHDLKWANKVLDIMLGEEK